MKGFADAYPQAFFIEIGSNDGEQHDHLQPLIVSGSWRGIMVEPVPYVFERLRRNYGGIARVILENAAIADRDGTLPFYHLAEPGDGDREGLPGWYDAIGSFSRDAVVHHAKHIPDIERRLVCAQVPALTFESLCAKHAVDRVDLIVIDTEGYDWEILRRLDLRARHPRLVVYEHFHLAPDDRRACREQMQNSGYETMEEGFDTWCLDPSADDRLTRLWRGLRPAVPGVSAHEGA
ncbi:MAG: hypothetical protein QOI98_2251 [Solirubrobacteraceae bacterium]|nr:hypothetical protein [Solirubrobacteraceae bacterium]